MHVTGPSPMPTLRVIDPQRARWQRRIVVGLWLATVLAAYAVGRYVMIPDAGGLSAQLAKSEATNESMRARLSDVEQRLAIVERAEQIARLANENIQSALAGKDDEIAELRRDLAIYDRLIGPDAVKETLTVYDLRLYPANDGSVAFRAILTQNRDVRRGSQGRLTLSVEGRRDERLERLAWPDLATAGEEQGLPYDFRYFQRVEGRFMLPRDFQPLSVRAVLKGREGETVERNLSWERAAQTGDD